MLVEALAVRSVVSYAQNRSRLVTFVACNEITTLTWTRAMGKFGTSLGPLFDFLKTIFMFESCT